MTRHDVPAKSFVDILRRRAEEQGEQEAIGFLGSHGDILATLTYAALDRRARAIAASLSETCAPGDRALIAAPTGAAYVTALFGCMYAGVIAVTAHPPRWNRRHGESLGLDPRTAAIMASANPCVILGDGDVHDFVLGESCSSLRRMNVEAISSELAATWREPCEREMVAVLQYTSGSTTVPRGVRVTHGNLLQNSALIAARMDASAADRGLCWLPLFHDMGLVGALLQPIFVGFPGMLMRPADFIAQPLRWLAALSRYRATIVALPNWGYDLCVQQTTPQERATLDLSALRVCVNGSEPIRAESVDAFAEAFAPCGFHREAFLPSYGLAESTLFVSGGGPHRGRIHRVDREGLLHGAVLTGQQVTHAQFLVGCGACDDAAVVAIVNPETGQRAAPGRIGEIWVRSPSVADGYWQQPDETTRVFGARISDTGEGPFLRTGDLGFLADGELVVTGRLKDMIIIRGENYYPQDIESLVESAHPAIAKRGAVAFGVEQDNVEQCWVIAELTRQGLRRTEAERDQAIAAIRSAVAESVGLTLAGISLIGPLSLPRTSSGKVRRQECKSMWLSGQLRVVQAWSLRRHGEPVAVPQTVGSADTLSLLLQAAAETLQLPAGESVRPDMSLRAAGLDSLGLVGFKRRIERSIGLDVPLSLFDDNPLFSELAERLRGMATHIEKRTSVCLSEPGCRGPGQMDGAPAGLSLMFFSSNEAERASGKYDHVLEAASIADRGGLAAIWLPERHFHPFGGLFPDPAVLAGALALRTQNIRLRAGSIVLPLHDPISVLERWAMVDNLSNGRVDLALASGWDADTFCLAPDAYGDRVTRTLSGIAELQSLWRGTRAKRKNGQGDMVDVRPLPQPIQRELACWLTVAQRGDLIDLAGSKGLNVLTALLFQPIDVLAQKIARYRQARREAGLDPATGKVTLMLHTYLGDDPASVRETVRPAFLAYLRSSIDLWGHEVSELGSLNEKQREEVVHLAFERYFKTAGLFGSPESCVAQVRELQAVGIDEIACLVDFGVQRDRLIAGVERLARLQHLLDAPQSRAVSVPPPTAEHLSPMPIDLDARHRLARQPVSDVFGRARNQPLYRQLREAELMPFYGEFGKRRGAFIQHQGREVLQLGALDYLGLSTDERVCAAAAAAALEEGTSRTGSRLHNGSTARQRRFERSLAEFLGREDALIFATGYQAQLGLVSGLMDPDSVLLLDELAHASLYDGARIAETRVLRFAHSDPASLDGLLRGLARRSPAMVVCEGIYSNEGDLPPLREIAAVCRRHGARLAIDEAHSLGVLGSRGRGIEEELDLVGAADLLSGTFSKSLASIGGFIAGPTDVIDWIRFNARSILFSAAIAPASLAAAETALQILSTEPQRVALLRELALVWRAELRAQSVPVEKTGGPIVPLYLPNDLACLQAARRLLERGMYVNAVVAPSAPRGQALLRTCVTALHEPHDLKWAASVVAETLAGFPADSLRETEEQRTA